MLGREVLASKWLEGPSCRGYDRAAVHINTLLQKLFLKCFCFNLTLSREGVAQYERMWAGGNGCLDKSSKRFSWWDDLRSARCCDLGCDAVIWVYPPAISSSPLVAVLAPPLLWTCWTSEPSSPSRDVDICIKQGCSCKPKLQKCICVYKCTHIHDLSHDWKVGGWNPAPSPSVGVSFSAFV